jgi:DNA invertase Pin-like site-specific DNA recombinase
MKVGYGRTSTSEQVAGLEAQERDLKTEGCERLFLEQLSSVDDHRPQLEAAIDFCRAGDVFMVTKLDRLARSVIDALEIQKRLKEKGVALKILDPGIDTSNEIGQFIFTVLASVAQLERGMMLARQREGVAKAKREGKYMGRKPTVLMRADEIRKLNAEGKSAIEIAEELGIHRSGVYRVLDKESDVEARLEGKLKAWRDRKGEAA